LRQLQPKNIAVNDIVVENDSSQEQDEKVIKRTRCVQRSARLNRWFPRRVKSATLVLGVMGTNNPGAK
jgi:hypothetical protein